jgi:hypothetical protein
MASALQHQQFKSSVDTAFWAALSEVKMTKLKLESTPQPLCALYAPAVATAHGREEDGGGPDAAVAWMNLTGEALDAGFEAPRRCVRASGTVTVVNTMEEFKDIDKKDFLNKVGAQMCVLREWARVGGDRGREREGDGGRGREGERERADRWDLGPT